MDSTDNRSGGEPAGEFIQKRPSLIIPTKSPAEALQKGFDLTPSPMTILSSILAEQDKELKSETYTQMLAGALSPPSAALVHKEPPSPETANEEEKPASIPSLASRSPLPSAFSSPSPSSSSSRPSSPLVSAVGGPADESSSLPPLAAGALLSAGATLGHKVTTGGSGRSNIARFKTMTPSRLPIPRSPCLTIPPGLSPTTLLDSPVLLSTGQAEPSPTTGTFPLPPISQGSGPVPSATSDGLQKSSDEDDSATFAFKPFPKMNRNPPSPLSKMGAAHPPSQPQLHTFPPLSAPSTLDFAQALPQSASASFWESHQHAPLAMPVPAEGGSEASMKAEVAAVQPATVAQPAPVAQLAAVAQPLVVERPSEDGYNWRKYGQKQVKGSEFPRSYYKCTHPNCSVKKKVERSHDGQVTEIVYKGEHDHPKPQSVRRSSMANAHASNSCSREGLSMAAQRLNFPGGTAQNSELSLGSISDGEGSKADEGDDEEPDSKRRKESAGEASPNVPLRTIREPRVVVQTTSEVDILDDGYRWRKYGQKVVKGNPHPRSYYKCTNLGCSVRKHVERSSADPRAVITTYEGKHNHDVPASKNSNHHDSSAMQNSGSAQPLNNVPKSVQDHYMMGKMWEDRLKVDERAMSHNLTNMQMPNVSMFQMPRSQGVTDPLVPTSVSFIGTGMNGPTSLRGAEISGQSVVIRPKEEQDEGNLSSWPSSYVKSSPSQGPVQRPAQDP